MQIVHSSLFLESYNFLSRLKNNDLKSFFFFFCNFSHDFFANRRESPTIDRKLNIHDAIVSMIGAMELKYTYTIHISNTALNN